MKKSRKKTKKTTRKVVAVIGRSPFAEVGGAATEYWRNTFTDRLFKEWHSFGKTAKASGGNRRPAAPKQGGQIAMKRHL